MFQTREAISNLLLTGILLHHYLSAREREREREREEINDGWTCLTTVSFNNDL